MLIKRLGVVLIFSLLCSVLISCSTPANNIEEISKEPDPSLLLSEAERLLSEGEYQEAILQYEAAIEIEPRASAGYIGLANTYLSQDDPQGALEPLLLALENGVDDPGAVTDIFIQALSAAGGYAMQMEEDYYCVLPDGTEVYRLSNRGAFSPVGDEYAFSLDPRYGNTPANISAGGFGAQRDGWVYLSTYNTTGLYRMRAEGGNCTKLHSGNCSFINVQGGWVYFCDEENGGKFCRMRTDGTQLEVLNPEKTIYSIVYGEWIYYISVPSSDAVFGFAFENFGSLYRSKTDGSEKVCLLEGEVSSLSLLNGEWLYYCDRQQDYGIGRIRTDGSENQMIADRPALGIQAAEGGVYWLNRITDGEIAEIYETHYADTIFHMTTDGTQMEEYFRTDFLWNTLVDRNRVFAERPSSESEPIHISDSSMTSLSMLHKDACQLGFSLLDGWIYYYTFEPMSYESYWDFLYEPELYEERENNGYYWNDNHEQEPAGFYRIRSNGENRQLVYPLDWREG